MNIFTSLPAFSGFTKIVSEASPRFRLRIEEFGVIRSLPSLVQPCALRFAANSAQTVFTADLLLKERCSTRAWYSRSVASFVRARSFTLSTPAAGWGVGFSLRLAVVGLVGCLWPRARPLRLYRAFSDRPAETLREFLPAARQT